MLLVFAKWTESNALRTSATASTMTAICLLIALQNVMHGMAATFNLTDIAPSSGVSPITSDNLSVHQGFCVHPQERGTWMSVPPSYIVPEQCQQAAFRLINRALLGRRHFFSTRSFRRPPPRGDTPLPVSVVFGVY